MIFQNQPRMATRQRRTVSPTSRNVFLVLCIFVILAAIGLIIGFSHFRKRDLKMVHVVMRHGIRTPADTYPNDPYINDTFYPVGWGQLSNDGKVQMYRIGQYLRRRYGTFLGRNYNPSEFYAESTDSDRTKMSLQLVSAAIWSPSRGQVWGPLQWQPVPIRSQPLGLDMLLLVRKPCAAYHKERDRVLKTEEILTEFEHYQDLFRNLTEVTGKTIEDFDDVMDVFSTLKAEESFHLTLPEWTKLYYPQEMLTPTIFSFILNSWNDKMNRLKGGILLKQLIEDWNMQITDPSKVPKTRVYCGHDSTIVNIMRTLKIWDSQMPEYGITVLFELSKDRRSDQYGVEIFLRNSTTVPPHKLTIPGCQSFCPLNLLQELTRNVVPEHWEEECENDGTYDVPELGGP